MSLLELRSDLSLPYLILLAGAGLWLSIRLGFPQFQHLLLSLKILSGALDWKGSKGKITPVEAFTSGSSGPLIPLAAIGAAAATAIAGTGILIWIYLATLLVMPLQFAETTLAVKFRKNLPDGTLLSGPALFIEYALKARWLALFFSVLFLADTLLAGASFPIVIAHDTLLSNPPITLSIAAAILLVLIILGGIRRIAWTSRYLFLTGIFFLIPAILLFQFRVDGHSGFFTFFGDSLLSFWPENWERARSMFLGLSVYLVLTEAGNGKLAALTGTVRTDHPAKQGLAAMMPALFQGFVTASIAVYGYSLLAGGYPAYAGLESPALFRAVAQPVPAASILMLLSFSSFLLASMSGWLFSGLQTAQFLAGRAGRAFFPILFLAGIFGTGYYLRIAGESASQALYLASICAGMATSLFSIIASALLARTARLELTKYLDTARVRYEISKDMYLLLLSVLPQNLISRIFGWLTYIRLPRFMMVPILQAFARFYKINLDEAELDIKSYPSLNKFFTRALREGARIVDTSERAIVSPVDGRVSQFGDITEGMMIQAKGILYTLKDLLDTPDYAPLFADGRYAVIYLSPQDYHRIHSPFGGTVAGYTYTPGKLFTVNQIAVNGLVGLFPKNERLTTFLKTEFGLIAVVKVGATNVGKIRVTYDTVATNRWIRITQRHKYEKNIPMDKGQELGRFEMGSTVILLFQKDTMDFLPTVTEGTKVRYGQAIGKFRK